MRYTCQMQGRPLPADIVGPLTETDFDDEQPERMRQQLDQDGYLFFRDVLSVPEILTARAEVFERLAEVGEIRLPVSTGTFTGSSNRRELCPDLGHFWQSVSEGPALRLASHGHRITHIVSSILGEPAHAHDYLFLRPAVPGRSPHLHYDHPFFARGSDRIHTAWTPLGDIPLAQGPLMIVEGSNHFHDLISQAKAVDYSSSSTPLVQLMDDPAELARQRGSRLLTADFRAGDLILFSMTLLHGSLDNQSTEGHIRLSCDVRWQPATDPIDPRYAGPHLTGTTGAGYGELNGAKPLDEPWHQR